MMGPAVIVELMLLELLFSKGSRTQRPTAILSLASFEDPIPTIAARRILSQDHTKAINCPSSSEL